MSRRALVVTALYAVGIVFLAWFRELEPSRSDLWVAARKLAANHQLGPGDLSGPRERHRRARMMPIDSLTGRHLVALKRAGDAITPADLLEVPKYQPGQPGSRVVIYRLKGDEFLASAADQGSWVVPCYVRPGTTPPGALTTRCSKTPLLVEAVHRPATAVDNTWLALRLPRCQIREIGEFLAREDRFLLIAPAGPNDRPPQ